MSDPVLATNCNWPFVRRGDYNVGLELADADREFPRIKVIVTGKFHYEITLSPVRLRIVMQNYISPIRAICEDLYRSLVYSARLTFCGHSVVADIGLPDGRQSSLVIPENARGLDIVVESARHGAQIEQIRQEIFGLGSLRQVLIRAEKVHFVKENCRHGVSMQLLHKSAGMTVTTNFIQWRLLLTNFRRLQKLQLRVVNGPEVRMIGMKRGQTCNDVIAQESTRTYTAEYCRLPRGTYEVSVWYQVCPPATKVEATRGAVELVCIQE
jgi:hypothetical protein